MSISIATWNTEWATPNSDRGRRISSILHAAGADIAVVTEEFATSFRPPAPSSMQATTGVMDRIHPGAR